MPTYANLGPFGLLVGSCQGKRHPASRMLSKRGWQGQKEGLQEPLANAGHLAN